MDSAHFVAYFGVATILPIPMAYVFRVHKPLFVETIGAKTTLVICSIAAVVGLSFLVVRPGIYAPVVTGSLLLLPIMQFMFFKFMWKRFLKTYHREPRDTFWLNPNYSTEVPDIAFVLGFSGTSIFVGLILIALLTAFGY